MPDEYYYLSKAVQLAKKAAKKNEVPVGAVVVHDASVVGCGFNLRESHQNPCAHAEILALIAASKKLKSWRLVECTLYVTLEPCLMCLAACQQARLKRVVFGARDLKGGALSLGYTPHLDRRMNHRFLVEHFEQPECAEILSSFFKMKR